MINLKEKIQALIDQATADNKTFCLEYDHSDSIAYYENDIIRAFEEYQDYDLTDDQKEILIDTIVNNQDQILDYISSGFIYNPDHLFGVHSINEISIPIDDQLYRRKASINYHTDLYIGNNDYGYITLDYDYIAIDFNSVDPLFKEALIAQLDNDLIKPKYDYQFEIYQNQITLSFKPDPIKSPDYEIIRKYQYIDLDHHQAVFHKLIKSKDL